MKFTPFKFAIQLITFTMAAILTILISLPSVAQTSDEADFNALATGGNHEILQDVKAEVKKCVVELLSQPAISTQSVNTNTKVVSFESNCDSLRILSADKAQILIGNEWYTAIVNESKDSDGGDLDNMTLFNAQGEVVAVRTNVPAYNQVVLAMLGGDSHELQQRMMP